MVDKLCVSQASCLKLGVSKAQLKELGYLITWQEIVIFIWLL